MGEAKLFTVVIALHNQETELRKFIEWHNTNQKKLRKISFLIKDSGNNFSQKEKIEQTTNINFICKPDTSIYQAWNQSMEFIETEYVMFLGITDRIIKLPREIIKETTNRKHHLIYFDFILIRNSNKIISKLNKEKIIKNFPIRPSFCFSSSLIKTDFLKEYKFNETYKIIGDFDFLLKNLYHLKYKYVKSPPIIEFHEGGISNSFKTFTHRLNEYKKITKEAKYSILHYYTYFIITYLRHFTKD